MLNGFYLLAVLENSPYLILIQASIAVFKFGWSQFVAVLVTTGAGALRQQRGVDTFLLSLQLFNFVVAPCLATAVSDSNCFYNLFNRQSAQSGASHGQCLILALDNADGQIGFECVSSTGLTGLAQPLYPPFVYHYQCSSALIVNYVPVLLYTFVFISVGAPAALLLCFRFRKAILRFCHVRVVREVFPRLYLMLYDHRSLDSNETTAQGGSGHMDASSEFGGELSRSTEFESTSQSEKNKNKKPLFQGGLFMSKLMLHAVVLMTFGLAAPYLAFIVVCSLLAQLAEMRLLIGRYFFIVMSTSSSDTSVRLAATERRNGQREMAEGSSEDQSQRLGIELSFSAFISLEDTNALEAAESKLSTSVTSGQEAGEVIEIMAMGAHHLRPATDSSPNAATLLAAAQREVEEALEGVWAYPYDGMWLVVLVAQLFWALLFFDMVGDVYGFEAGLKAMVATMLCLPLLTYWLARIILASKPTLGSCMRSEQRVTSKTDLGLPGFQEPHVRAEVMNIIGAEQVRYFSKNSMEFIVFFSIRR